MKKSAEVIPDCSKDGLYRYGKVAIKLSTDPETGRFMMVVYKEDEIVEIVSGCREKRGEAFGAVYKAYGTQN